MHRDNIQIGFSDFGSSEIIEGDFYDLDSLNCYIVITDENKLSLVIEERTKGKTKKSTILDPSFIIFSAVVKAYSIKSVRYFCRDVFVGILTQTGMWHHNILSTEMAKLYTLMPKDALPVERNRFIYTSCEKMFKKYDNLSDDELLKFFYDCLTQLSDSCPVALFGEEETFKYVSN